MKFLAKQLERRIVYVGNDYFVISLIFPLQREMSQGWKTRKGKVVNIV